MYSWMLSKAKTEDNGEWVIGTYREMYDGERKIPLIEYHIGDKKITRIVKENTLCTCTGATDFHGNLIFENDLVDVSEKRGAAFSRCRVTWNYSKARYDVNTLDCDFPMMLDGLYGDISVCGLDYKIIGNIYDN